MDNQINRISWNKFVEMLDKIIVYMLALTAFLVVVVFYLKTYDSCFVKTTVLQVGCSVVIGIWLIKMAFAGRIVVSKRQKIIFYAAIAFALWGVFSFLMSAYKGMAIDGFIKRIIYTGLFLIVFLDFNKEKRKILLVSIIAATAVSVIYGFVQFLDTWLWRSTPASGIDPFIWRGAFGTRVFSTFGNPEFFTAFLLFILPVLVAFYMAEVKTRKKIGILLVLVIFNLIFANIKTKKESAASGIYRPAAWATAVGMIKDNIILGTGIGSYYAYFPKYQKTELLRLEGRLPVEYPNAESFILQVWAEEGIFGLLMFLALIISVISAGVKKIKEKNMDSAERYIVKGLLISIIVAFAYLAIWGQSYIFAPMLFVWLLMGLLANSSFGNAEMAATESKAIWLKVFSVVLGVGVIVFSIICFPRFLWADKNHNTAIFYSKRGQWNEAIELYEKVLKDNPNYIMAHYFLGNAYSNRRQKGDYELALKKYEDVKKMAPNYLMVHIHIAQIYSKMGKWQEAAENYKKFLQQDPVFERTYYMLAMVYIQQKKYSDARKVFIEGLRWHPDNADFLVNIGNMHYLEKKYAEAEACYQKAYDMNPGSMEILKNLKMVQEKMKKQN